MRLRNPYDDTVDLPTIGVTAKPGEVVDVAGQTAQDLIAQGWPRVDKPKPKPKKAATTTDQGDEPTTEETD